MEAIINLLFVFTMLFFFAGITYMLGELLWDGFMYVWDRFIIDLYKRKVGK